MTILTTPELKAPNLARRMACWLYEGMLVFGVIFIAACVFSLANHLFETSGSTQDGTGYTTALQAFLFVIIGIYFVWTWAKGQTLAMKTWEIQVVNLMGQPISQARALLRYVLSWLWLLPALAAAGAFDLTGPETAVVVAGWVAVWAILSRFHPQRQFWHDALAGTRLVPAPRQKLK